METKSRARVWRWIGLGAVVVISVLVIAVNVVLQRAGPILKRRVEATLRSRFESRVELDTLDVSVLRGVEVSGNGLRIYPPESPESNSTHPLIAVRHFSFHAGVLGLIASPTRVRRVWLNGLEINVPPREARSKADVKPQGSGEKPQVVVDRIICDDSRLVIETLKPGKDPKDFELRHIEMQNVGADAPWRYGAVLQNAIPKGDIHATGTFGPWRTDNPGDSVVTGHYTFEHADLNTIKGIGGTLSSVGDFQGQLNKIVVDGTTETPDFSLDTASHPMPLHTRFHAIVDGTTGDTYLQPVTARLKDSSFTTSGSVINIKGHGHQIELDVDIPNGHLQDFLTLSVKTNPAVMTATVGTKAKLQIRPGKESVSRKLSMQGHFTLGDIHFTNPKVQDKVDMLSLRAQGEPQEARPGAPDVSSKMSGTFQMADGEMRLSDLNYSLPGAQVNLDGVYSLDGQRFDFRGKVLTDASLSRMVDSRVASFLLKAVSPFFKRKGGGAEIPVSIHGTESEPKFGLDLFHKKDREE